MISWNEILWYALVQPLTEKLLFQILFVSPCFIQGGFSVLLNKKTSFFCWHLSPDENGKDQGVNVRHKVKELVEFVQDDDKLREERKKAKKNKDKYIGVSSDSMSYRGYRKSSASLVRQTHKSFRT